MFDSCVQILVSCVQQLEHLHDGRPVTLPDARHQLLLRGRGRERRRLRRAERRVPAPLFPRALSRSFGRLGRDRLPRTRRTLTRGNWLLQARERKR